MRAMGRSQLGAKSIPMAAMLATMSEAAIGASARDFIR